MARRQISKAAPGWREYVPRMDNNHEDPEPITVEIRALPATTEILFRSSVLAAAEEAGISEVTDEHAAAIGMEPEHLRIWFRGTVRNIRNYEVSDGVGGWRKIETPDELAEMVRHASEVPIVMEIMSATQEASGLTETEAKNSAALSAGSTVDSAKTADLSPEPKQSESSASKWNAEQPEPDTAQAIPRIPPAHAPLPTAQSTAAPAAAANSGMGL